MTPGKEVLLIALIITNIICMVTCIAAYFWFGANDVSWLVTATANMMAVTAASIAVRRA